MTDVHIAIGVIALALTALAAGWGAWFWWRRRPSVWFWRILRAAQVAVVVEIALGGLLVAIGRKAVDLHYLYGVLPIVVSLFGEQLRISSAQLMLDKRGLASGQEVGQLPRAEQQEIVMAIVRREIGVMTLAAIVSLALLARAATVIH